MDPSYAFHLVAREFDRASLAHGDFASPHEGYAVILEEMDELWAEVKGNPRLPGSMREEAVQVAAMAIRFLADCCPEED